MALEVVLLEDQALTMDLCLTVLSIQSQNLKDMAEERKIREEQGKRRREEKED